MNFVRLSTISPELVALLSSKETTHLVRVSAATVDWVFKEVEVVDSRVTAGRVALSAQDFGDSVVRTQVFELVEELDVVAWDLQDSDGSGDSPAYLLAFRRARAVDSLWNALAGGDLEATMDCVYEAFAASDSHEALEQLVVSAATE